ncbi:MAG: hypothetical protein ACRELV_05935 [Longimicrobiales bacterium]
MPARRGMPGVLRAALAFAVLLGSLSLVIRRQSHALDTLRDLDELRMESALAEARRADLTRRTQTLESRGRIVAVARTDLGMHVPVGDEIVILPLAPDAPAAVQLVVSQPRISTGRGGEAELGGAEVARHARTRVGGIE